MGVQICHVIPRTEKEGFELRRSLGKYYKIGVCNVTFGEKSSKVIFFAIYSYLKHLYRKVLLLVYYFVSFSIKARSSGTVHEMARDEARHGKAFKGLLERYFK